MASSQRKLTPIRDADRSVVGLGKAEDEDAPGAGIFGAASTGSGAAVVTTASVTSTITTTVKASVVAGVSTPTWVGSLTDAGLKADMISVVADGVVTYGEILTVVTDLSSSLSTVSGLSANQFSDLKAIAANWNNGVTMSSYVDDILNRFVNGDAANAYYTGGGTATALGNLRVGSTVTQLNQLIGKWFLGNDLPSTTVMMNGSTIKVTYKASTAPLFGVGGPVASDINQGYLNDCYLLAPLASIARSNPGLISSMFVDNGNNTYGVRFFTGGKEDWVTVNAVLPMTGAHYSFNDAYNNVGNIWVNLIEKAYVQINTQGVYTGNYYANFGNSFSTIGSGGTPDSALQAVTGSKISHYVVANNAETINALVNALAAKNDISLCSWTNSYDSAGYQCLVAGHAMSVTGFDAATGKVTILNPWGTKAGQNYRTTFEVNLSQLAGTGDYLAIDSVAALAPKLVSQTASQSWTEGQAVSFTLPTNTFSDPGGRVLSYSATQANGQALPSWLSFDAKTGKFSGIVPTGAAAFSSIVTATDTLGLSASETIQFAVAKGVTVPPVVVVPPASGAPVVSAQTANQVWNQGGSVVFTMAANTFTDPQGAAMTYKATLADGSALPSWLYFSTFNNSFIGRVAMGTAGLSIKVTAKDATGLTASETFSVTTPPPVAPIVSSQTASRSWTEGVASSFSLAANTFTDPQGSAMTYKATQANGQALPSWLTFTAATKTFNGLAPTGSADVSVKVTATDLLGLSGSETFSLVTAAAAGPVVASRTASQTQVVGSAVTFGLAAGAFTDSLPMTYAAYQVKSAGDIDATSWLRFDPTTRTFSGIAAANENGTLHLKVVATDTSGKAANDSFDISFKNSGGLTLMSTATLTGSQSSSASSLLAIAR